MKFGTLKSVVMGAVLAQLPAFAVEDHELELHPDYNLQTIRPNQPNRDRNGNTVNVWGAENGEFSAPVVGMDWFDEDHTQLLVQSWRGDTGPYSNGLTGNHARNGRLWLLSNIRSNNRSEITGELIADDFKDAHGVKVVDGEIYVSDIDALYKLEDNNNDGFYETKVKIGDIPSYDGWFEYTFGLVYKEEKFWIALASHVQISGNPAVALGPDRGVVIAMDMNGNYEVYCSGLRAPNGIALNDKDEIFVTDNQGGYRPSSMLIHVQQGKNYGYKNENDNFRTRYADQPVTPPSVWAVHGPIANGPTGPAFMPTGIFKGQFFAGDIGKGGIKRYFIEEVDGEYQGAIFPFTGAMEVGIDRIIIDDDGTIFAGGVGNGSDRNQGWLGTRQGLQRLDRKDKEPSFEVLAVRSRANGMELEFTQPVGNNAEQLSQYSGERYQMIPDTDRYTSYGAGNMLNGVDLNIRDVQVSEDRKKVFLEIDNLAEGWVVEIDLNNNYQSQSGQGAWFHTVWYTLHNISPTPAFDKPGCTDPDFIEFDPEATSDDGSCETLGVSQVFVDNFHYGLSANNMLGLNLPFEGHYKLELISIDGKVQFKTSLKGKGNHNVNLSQLKRGVYGLKISNGAIVHQLPVVLK